MTPLEQLLEELEANFAAWGHLALYEFAWQLRGFERDLTDDQFATTCQQAYDELTRRHRTRLVWTRWPINLDEARPVEPGTALDFDLDPDGDVNEPMLVLVPA